MNLKSMRLLACKILAKILFCDEQNLNNVLLHIPVGALITFLICYVSGWLGLTAILVFIKYETIERKVENDKCFPDLQGALWGLIGLGVIIALVRLI
jgi:hypothetical protein